MKLLSLVNERLAFKSQPYTPEEVDKHDDAGRIWATIAQCKKEADAACKQSWEDGYWLGLHK